MKRRTLLKTFPTLGLAFLFGTPTKADEPEPKQTLGPNWPDEDFLTKLLTDIEKVVGHQSSLAYIGAKADNSHYLRDDYNRTTLTRNKLELSAHFNQGKGDIYVHIEYTWNIGNSLCIIDAKSKDHRCDLPDDLQKVKALVLAQVRTHTK